MVKNREESDLFILEGYDEGRRWARLQGKEAIVSWVEVREGMTKRTDYFELGKSCSGKRYERKVEIELSDENRLTLPYGPRVSVGDKVKYYALKGTGDILGMRVFEENGGTKSLWSVLGKGELRWEHNMRTEDVSRIVSSD